MPSGLESARCRGFRGNRADKRIGTLLRYDPLQRHANGEDTYEGRYDRNGSLGRLYTNAPYYLHWGGSTGVFHDVACTSIVFDTSNYPPFVNTTDFYRYAANPVRCVRE